MTRDLWVIGICKYCWLARVRKKFLYSKIMQTTNASAPHSVNWMNITDSDSLSTDSQPSPIPTTHPRIQPEGSPIQLESLPKHQMTSSWKHQQVLLAGVFTKTPPGPFVINNFWQTQKVVISQKVLKSCLQDYSWCFLYSQLYWRTSRFSFSSLNAKQLKCYFIMWQTREKGNRICRHFVTHRPSLVSHWVRWWNYAEELNLRLFLISNPRSQMATKVLTGQLQARNILFRLIMVLLFTLIN